ncbi:MAG: hypothetical protein WC346_13375 [Methanogenium sp.]|jgi:hypothetical protein
MAKRDAPFELEQTITDNWNKNPKDGVTKYLKSMGLKGKAEKIGNIQFETSKVWQKYGGHPKSFGKADIKIGDSNISLKSTDDHLIFSGAKGESKAIFLSIANIHYKQKVSSILNRIVNHLDTMVGSAFTPSTIGKAKKTDYLVQQAGIVHGKVKDEILHFFKKDEKFQKLAIKEMLSGKIKFGKDSLGVADYVLYPGPELLSINDPKIFTKADIDIRVDFKSQSAPASGNVNNYRYWSVVQLIQKRFRVDEDIENQYLKKDIGNLINLLRFSFINEWEDLLGFLELDIE